MIDENKLNGESCNLRLGNFHWRTDLNTRVCRELVITRKSQYYFAFFAVRHLWRIWLNEKVEWRPLHASGLSYYLCSLFLNKCIYGRSMHFLFQAWCSHRSRFIWLRPFTGPLNPPVADSFGWQPITSPSAAGRQLIVSPKSEWRGMHGSYLCSPFAHIMKYSYKDV